MNDAGRARADTEAEKKIPALFGSAWRAEADIGCDQVNSKRRAPSWLPSLA